MAGKAALITRQVGYEVPLREHWKATHWISAFVYINNPGPNYGGRGVVLDHFLLVTWP